MLSSPQTKLMCGVVLMKECGFFNTPCFTCQARNWRVTWNDSLISTALLISILPSFSGV